MSSFFLCRLLRMGLDYFTLGCDRRLGNTNSYSWNSPESGLDGRDGLQSHIEVSNKNKPLSLLGFPVKTIMEFGFLVFALAPLIHYGPTPTIATFSLIFSGILLEALPFLLLGVLVGGLMEVWVSREKLSAWFEQRKWYTIFLAAGLGFVFPVCECAIIPVLKRLMEKGMPLSAAVAFLLGGPIVNPIVFASTVAAYGMILDIAVIRLLFGYGIAVFAGFTAGCLLEKQRAVLGQETASVGAQDTIYTACCEGSCNHTRPGFMDAVTHGAEDFLDMFRYLIFGAFAAALAQTLMDREVFLILSENTVLSIGLMMAFAVVTSLCSEVDAFVAASFRFSLPLASQMAFMVLGPMFDIKLLFMALCVFKRGAVATIYGLTISTVLIAMLLFHFSLMWFVS